MSDSEFVIDVETGDTEGHLAGRGVVEPEDADWLEQKLRGDGGPVRFRILSDDSDDTEGHGGTITVRARIAGDDDDTEGHAIAIHFPSRKEADAFRRRLLVTGVLVGTVALGAAGGAGLASMQTDQGSAGAAGAVTTQTGPMDAHEAPAFGVNTAAQTGPMDAHEAPAFQGLSAAEQAYADRLSGQAAAAQTGPMDAHEAPAFQSSADDDAPAQGSGTPTPR